MGRKNSQEPNFVKWSAKVKLEIKRKGKKQNGKKLQKILDFLFKEEKFFMSREMRKKEMSLFSFFLKFQKENIALFEISKYIFFYKRSEKSEGAFAVGLRIFV